MATFEYILPAIRGIQAGREYYVTQFPLRLIPRLFLFNEVEVKPELRAQRTLNKGRIPEIARYIARNPKSYILSALTASIDGPARFEPLGDGDAEQSLGRLRIPMQARLLINDGQHRRAGIEEALRTRPELGDETIAVVLFRDLGLKRAQQAFADLNRFAVRPSPSLTVLFDHRDERAVVVKSLISRVEVFAELIETERGSLPIRSNKLFSLSGLYQATQTLLSDRAEEPLEARVSLAAEFWTEVGGRMPDWQDAAAGRANPAALRREFVHAHALALSALARVGQDLLTRGPLDRDRLKKLEAIDWSRDATHWKGRALVGGQISKRAVNITLTANLIKGRLGLKLSPEERSLEATLEHGDHHGQGA